jgi:hypothetical protein
MCTYFYRRVLLTLSLPTSYSHWTFLFISSWRLAYVEANNNFFGESERTGRGFKLILVSFQNLCGRKATTDLAQSGTSVMVVFHFNENIVGNMPVSHQVNETRIWKKLQVTASLKPPLTRQTCKYNLFQSITFS